MRARDAVGKRIVKVEQFYVSKEDDACHEGFWALSRIVLENGTVLSVSTRESESGGAYYQVIDAYKQARK